MIPLLAIISEDKLDIFVAEDREVEMKHTRKTAQQVQQEILKLLHDDTQGEWTISSVVAKELILQACLHKI